MTFYSLFKILENDFSDDIFIHCLNYSIIVSSWIKEDMQEFYKDNDGSIDTFYLKDIISDRIIYLFGDCVVNVCKDNYGFQGIGICLEQDEDFFYDHFYPGDVLE